MKSRRHPSETLAGASFLNYCLFLCPRGRGIDLKERKRIANPRGCPRGLGGGGGLQVKLLNAVFGQEDQGVLFSHGHFLGINPIGPSKEQISSEAIREFSSPVDTFWV